jgi:halimadienyl-diphosphate synthase
MLEWLLDTQRPDGSWGGEIPYYHDRVLCTLAAAITLRENGHRRRDQKAIECAQRYLWQHMHWLPRDHCELIGFELIFPTLLDTARAVGLDVPYHTYGYGKLQAAKLRLIPPDRLYSPRLSTVHSLEFLGRIGDRVQLRQALSANGSLGNSPAATAYFLMLAPEDARALDYLEKARGHAAQQHVSCIYPFRTFELSWSLNHLALSGLPLTAFADRTVWESLSADMTSSGIGLDSTFGIPDGDITAVSSRILIQAGLEVDSAILARFENQDTHTFATYDYERNASVTTNVHALEALDVMPDYPHRDDVRQRIFKALLTDRRFDLYWTDKRHASPYYATAHVLVALIQREQALEHNCQDVVEWLMHNQQTDGSWGFFQQGTAEETAYVLIALLHYYQRHPFDPDVLHRGAAYLEYAYRTPITQQPELWVGKCLYIPYDVVRAAILAALLLYQNTFGRAGG